MDPPIQWVGVPLNQAYNDVEGGEHAMVQIDFGQLCNSDKFHYIFGMFFYCSKSITFYLFQFSWWTVKNAYYLIK